MTAKELINLFFSREQINIINIEKQYKYVAVDIFDGDEIGKVNVFFVFYHSIPQVTGSCVVNIDEKNIPDNLPKEWGKPITYWYTPDPSEVSFYGEPHPETKYVSVQYDALDIKHISSHFYEIAYDGDLIEREAQEPNTHWLKLGDELLPIKQSQVDETIAFVTRELKSRSRLIIERERDFSLDTGPRYTLRWSWGRDCGKKSKTE